MNATLKGSYSAPRWAGASRFLKSLAFKLELELDIDIDKGWIFERVQFRVSGPRDGVRKFQEYFKYAIKKYNG